MNAESAAFVPSSFSRGRTGSNPAAVAAAGEDNLAPLSSSHASENVTTSTTSSKIPRSASAHTSLHAHANPGKDVQASSSTSGKHAGTSSHTRSQSVGGVNGAHQKNGQSNSNSARGGSSSQRGARGSSRGRGAGRGGAHTSSNGNSSHANTAAANANAKKPAVSPSQPPLSLDSVDDFPTLGGPSSQHHQQHSSSTSNPSLSPVLSKNSPTLETSGATSPDLSASHAPTHSAGGKQVMSFARVVAPTLPSSSNAHPTPSSASSTTAAPATSATFAAVSQSNTHHPARSPSNSTTASTQSTPASSLNHSSNASNASGEAHADSSPASSRASVTAATENAAQAVQATSTVAAPAMEQQTSKGGKKKGGNKNNAAGGTGAGAGGNGQPSRNAREHPGPHSNSQPQHQQHFGPHDVDSAQNMQHLGHNHNRDPFHVVVPDHNERPHFEMQQQGHEQQHQQHQQQPFQQSPLPLLQPPVIPGGLTPVQLAFIASNGLSVDGLPNVPDGVSIEELQNYYAAQQQFEEQQLQLQQQQQQQQQQSGQKGGKKEGGSKKSKRERQQQQQQQQFDPQQGFQQQQYPYNQDFGNYQYYDYEQGYYGSPEEQQQQQQQQQQGFPQPGFNQHQTQQAPQDHLAASTSSTSTGMTKSLSNSNFHFSPSAPTFQPHGLNASVPEFKPRSPVLNGDAPIFQSMQHENDHDSAAPGKAASEVDKAIEAVDDTPKSAASQLPEATVGEIVNESSPQVEESAKDAQTADTSEQAVNAPEDDPETVQSPPHSTFSLLPPVTVDDVLDKAKEIGTEAMETVQNATAEVANTIQNVVESGKEALEGEATSSEASNDNHEVKDNIDELAIPTEVEEAQFEDEAKAADSKTAKEVETTASSTADDAAANLDELDLPKLKTNEDSTGLHSKQSTESTETSSFNLSKHSMSPSEVEDMLLSSTEEQANLPALSSELNELSASESTGRSPFYIVSRSEDQCTTSTFAAEDANSTESMQGEAPSSTEDHITDPTAGTSSSESDAQSFVRSMAPSPPPQAAELPQTPSASSPDKKVAPALTIETPPIVLSPSTPLSPSDEAVPSPTKPTLSSPKPLAKAGADAEQPDFTRQASEAEKREAIRLVAESRSQPSTPAVESEPFEGTSAETPAEATGQEKSSGQTTNGDFRFDAKSLLELNSAKRKRGKTEEEEEDGQDAAPSGGDGDKPNGEAPSLTMSIFSGSIVPRKQLILSALASLGINLFLPFVNGVMLGFGEILARDWLGPLFGFVKRSDANKDTKTFSTSGLGLRNAGAKQRGGAQDVPGHAGTKTVIETAAEEVAKSTTGAS